MNFNNEIIPATDVLPERMNEVSITTPLDNPTAGFLVMKKCTKCGKEKEFSEYYFRNDRNRHVCICIVCFNKNEVARKKTKRGLVKNIHLAQSNRVYDISYSFEELYDWLFSQQKFHDLYDAWVASGYDRWKRPSIDRLDDYKGYSFDNVRLVTWRENHRKYHYDRVNGINNKQNIAICQYDKNGKFIREYFSIAYASRMCGINRGCLTRVLVGSRKTTGGYIWKYKLNPIR